VSLEAYPYNEGKKWQACNRTAWYSMEKYVIDTYEMIPPGEGNLMKAVAKQPVRPTRAAPPAYRTSVVRGFCFHLVGQPPASPAGLNAQRFT
jgi:hypothetical protein